MRSRANARVREAVGSSYSVDASGSAYHRELWSPGTGGLGDIAVSAPIHSLECQKSIDFRVVIMIFLYEPIHQINFSKQHLHEERRVPAGHETGTSAVRTTVFV